METYITFLITNFVLDLTIIFLVCSTFGLKAKRIELVILMVFSLVPSILFVFYKIKLVFLVLLKMAFYIFVSFFLIEEFTLKKILSLFGFEIFLFFSVYGFNEFFILFVRSVILTLFSKKLSIIFNLTVTFSLLIYIFLLNLLFTKLAKDKKFKNFLSKVSFYLFGRHIEITGLIDSGNALYDTVTKKSVVIIPLSVLRKFLSESECDMIRDKNYFGLEISHELEYVTVGGKKSYMPIVDIGEIQVERNGEKQNFECVLGIVQENFADEKKFECLLHREFL